jgi:hypothetical protein
VLKCLGSDGVWYNQLVKGKDDLRLDAVMQQLFSVVNTFLSLDSATAQRRLAIRTYKVRLLSCDPACGWWLPAFVPSRRRVPRAVCLFCWTGECARCRITGAGGVDGMNGVLVVVAVVV